MNLDNPSVRILDILNLPLMHRCPELGLIFDRASLKELQEIFPVLINSIFGLPGGVGWGLRTIQQANPHEFEILYNFFSPLGPMFRLLYRLLSDPVKFEIPIGFLPPKMQQMLEGGRYSSFYSDIITIDPFRRQIISLSLNAFDYFFIHFVTHGTIPLHKMYPTAMNINTEKTRTAYYFLTADYLCAFLSSDPHSVVQPQNIGTIKLATVTPTPNVQPMKRPKYLLLSAISNHAPTAQAHNSPRHVDSPRASIWRSESVLYLFVDAWLRCDFDDSIDLPSNEFIRLVRVLVKQLHSFGNSAEQDNSSMQVLRQIAQPLMNAKMYGFLKSLISRWPLDSSFSDVLELWLSFIQPWRYTHNRDLNLIAEMPIPARFDTFIAENLHAYTQIYIKLIPRFERTDFSTLKNVFMLYRVLKVFGQSNLSEFLKRHEHLLLSGTISGSYLDPVSLSPGSMGLKDKSSSSASDWRPYSQTETLEEPYVPLFTGDFVYKLEELTRKILVVKNVAKNNLKEAELEYDKTHKGLIGFIKSIFSFEEDTILSSAINDKKKIPEILDYCAQSMKAVFDVNVPEPDFNASMFDDDEVDTTHRSMSDFSERNMSDLSDASFVVSPAFMKNNIKNLKYGRDPALLPIRDAEIAFLVRFLHQLSNKLNQMFQNEITTYWHRDDIIGRLSRQVLLSPMVSRVFDKSSGVSVLKETSLPPRICLRGLASISSVSLIVMSMVLGYFLWGAPSYGLFLIAFFTCILIFIRTLVSDVRIEN